MKTIIKIIVAAIVAAGMAAVLVMHDASDNLAIAVFFGVGIMLCAIFGVFDGKRDESKYDSIRHKTGRRYGQAAIFVGAACVFMGTQSECEELCDDLWHYAQNARVEMLDGEETLEIL